MFLLIDIGGSNVRMALCAQNALAHHGMPPRLLATHIDATPKSYDEFLAQFRTYLTSHDQELFKGVPERIVIGIPGTRLEGVVTSCPFLPDYVGRQIAEDIATAAGIPASRVHVHNDAYMVGIGEYATAHEALKYASVYASVAYLTISTGVGGAIYGKQEIVQWTEHATVPAAGLIPPGYEPGRQIVATDPDRSLEELISGAATEKRFGRKPREITDLKYWNWSAQYLARGIWNAMCLRHIHHVIIGGPMIVRKPGIDIMHVQEHLGKIVSERPGVIMPKLSLAVHEDIGGLIGAAYIARAHHASRS